MYGIANQIKGKVMKNLIIIVVALVLGQTVQAVQAESLPEAIQAALRSSRELRNYDVEIDSRATGQIKLTGRARSEAEKKAIEQITAQVPGVKSIKNEIKVDPTGMQPVQSALARSVRQALKNDTTIGSYELTIVEKKGEIVLSGEVAHARDLMQIEELTRAVPGVKSVTNNLVSVPDKAGP